MLHVWIICLHEIAKNGYMNRGNWLDTYFRSMEHLGKMDSTTRLGPLPVINGRRYNPLRTYVFKGVVNGLLTRIGLFISSVPHGIFWPLKKGAIRATHVTPLFSRSIRNAKPPRVVDLEERSSGSSSTVRLSPEDALFQDDLFWGMRKFTQNSPGMS